MSKPIWVWKLGGSLLNLDDIPRRLDQAVASFPHRPLLVVGGGSIADAVRDWDKRFQIGEDQSHVLALRAMELNAHLMTTIWPRGLLVTDRSAADSAWRNDRVPILQTRLFLDDEERRDAAGLPSILPLPHTWEATSDTIAAWITLRWPADGLMLLKSIDRPLNDLGDAVDPAFSRFVDHIPSLKWLNLRTYYLSTHRF
ncbi:amino acid kinase family protein [Thalassoroseus pseudoceratinae]|uniref:amino acid kinase family protein n=1 Tax=Thalassoroseus pseudoceratinae TaxID=2713176 RepID=UPI001420BF82|nr:hypothetical protein [Thalassoroseus pseudoceratinae]